jgi:hypothetical protein
VQSKDIDDARADGGDAGLAAFVEIGVPLLLADAPDGPE